MEMIKNIILYKKVLSDVNKNDIEKIGYIVNVLIDRKNNHYLNLNQKHKVLDKSFVAIGEIIERDGVVGCVEGNDGWYMYCFFDRTENFFIGPFDVHGVIKALVCHMDLGNGEDFFCFTHEEEKIFINTHIRYDDFCKKNENM